MLLQRTLLVGATLYFLLAHQDSTCAYGSNQSQNNSKEKQACLPHVISMGADKNSNAVGPMKSDAWQHSTSGSQVSPSMQPCPETSQLYSDCPEPLLRAPQALLPMPALDSPAAALFGPLLDEDPRRSSTLHVLPLAPRAQLTQPVGPSPHFVITQEPRPEVLNYAINRVYNLCQIRQPHFTNYGQRRHSYPDALDSFTDGFSRWISTLIQQAETGSLAYRFGLQSLVYDPRFELLLRALEAGKHVVFVYWNADLQMFLWEYPYVVDNDHLKADCARLWQLMVKPCRVISYGLIDGPISFNDVNRLVRFTEDVLAPASVYFCSGGIAQRYFRG